MFDPRREERNNNLVTHFDPKNISYGNPYFGSKIRKETQNYENYMKWNGGGLEFRPGGNEDEVGVCSPPLWDKKSTPTSPVHARDHTTDTSLSPKSRHEAVVRGKLELMEMIKAMPESSYELSLKDLVENYQKPQENMEQECLVEENLKQESVKKVKRKAKMVRSGSNINENHNKGLFLKMVFPLPFGGSNKKRAINPYARVLSKSSSTKTTIAGDRGLKFVDKDWWKKRSSVSDENESGGMSASTSSSGSTDSARKKSGCLYGFSAFYLKKSRSAK